MEEKLSIGEYVETWYVSICPYCDKKNIHCNGDETDLSTVDVNVIECWNCHKEFALAPDEFEMGYIRSENGKQVPKELL